MYFLAKAHFFLAIVALCASQHYGGEAGVQTRAIDQDQYYHNRPPPPQILSHKQALNHDGNFKYLFTSENGLAQGETIAPDGSRNGGYSYVDPNGKKISVKYTAGKEGFKILEADHLPKAPQPVAPQPVAPLPVPQYQAAYQAAPQQQYNARPADDGQYKPQLYERPSLQRQYYNTAPAYSAPQISRAIVPSHSSNAIEERAEPEYNDEPGKANSFGSGYIFEFSG